MCPAQLAIVCKLDTVSGSGTSRLSGLALLDTMHAGREVARRRGVPTQECWVRCSISPCRGFVTPATHAGREVARRRGIPKQECCVRCSMSLCRGL